MRRAAALLLLVLLAGCSTNGEDRTPGAEVTNVGTASAEPTATESAEQNGTKAVAVELPGLPIGGSDVEFDAPSTQCADVSWTGGEIPEGVQVSISSFQVSPEFSLDDQPCGNGPPCLPGFVFTSSGGGCTVGVTWSGATPADGQGSLAADAGTVACADEQTCSDFTSAVESAGIQTIGLTVLPPPEE